MTRYFVTILFSLFSLSAFAQTDSLSRDSIYKELSIANVSVTGHLRKQDAEKESFFVTDSLRKGIISTAQLLDKLPYIRVDRVSEEIKVDDISDILLLVNGHEVNQRYVMSIHPDRIKKVEVIRRPIGQYSDYQVVINIELRAHYVGWDIAPSTTDWFALKYGNSNRQRVSADGTFTSERWNIYGSSFFVNRNMREVAASEKKYRDEYSEVPVTIDYHHPNQKKHSNELNLSFGVDYQLSPKHTVSMQLGSALEYLDMQKPETLMISDNRESYPLSRLTTNTYHLQNSAIAFSYRGSFAEKLYLTSNLTYNFYHVNEERNMVQGIDMSNYIQNCGEKHYINYSFDIGYLLSQKWNVRLGNMLIWRNYDNRRRDAVQPGYFSKEVRDKANVHIGFRPDNTFNILAGVYFLTVNTKIVNDIQRQTSWMPNVKMYWKPWTGIHFNFDYHCTVTYPTLDQLSTTCWQIDPYLYHTGNPSLEACVMHYTQIDIRLEKLFKLSYMWKNSSNDFTPWYQTDAKGMFVETQKNCTYHHTYLSISGDYNLSKKLSVRALLNYQWYTRYIDNSDKHHGYTYYVDTDMSYEMSRSLSLLASYFLRYDWIPLLQGREYNQEEDFGVGVNWKLLNGKLPVTMKMYFPTKLLSKRTYTSIDIPDYCATNYGDDRWYTFSFSVNVRYNFGKGKITKRSSSLEIEKEK